MTCSTDGDSGAVAVGVTKNETLHSSLAANVTVAAESDTELATGVAEKSGGVVSSVVVKATSHTAVCRFCAAEVSTATK